MWANCRALLQGQVDAAQAEVAEARDDLAHRNAEAASELGAARAVLANMKAPASATPLADRLGAPAWMIDLLTAALGSMAANGLGCGLIAFAAHGRRQNRTSELATPTATVPLRSKEAVVREADHAAQFAIEALNPSPNGYVELLAIHRAYREWCASKGVEELAPPQIGAALAALFDGTGVTFGERRGRRVANGLRIKRSKQQGRALTQSESTAAISHLPDEARRNHKIAASG